MLKGLDPLLSGTLLLELDHLGHLQDLAIVDANFPAYRPGAPVVRVDRGLVATLRAVLSVLPLEPNVPPARMAVDDDPRFVHPHMTWALASFEETAEVEAVPRAEFYRRADLAALVVLTDEMEPYANLILTKGVVLPSP